jgi:hypothetical protein
VRRRAAEHRATASEHVRELPWEQIAQVLIILARRWRSLSEQDRARLRRLVRDSQGRVGNLSTRQRLQLRRLLRKLDLEGLAGEIAPLARASRSRGRRCCCRRARA